MPSTWHNDCKLLWFVGIFCGAFLVYHKWKGYVVVVVQAPGFEIYAEVFRPKKVVKCYEDTGNGHCVSSGNARVLCNDRPGCAQDTDQKQDRILGRMILARIRG